MVGAVHYTGPRGTCFSGLTTTIRIPALTSPPTLTVLITPASRAVISLFASRTRNRSCNPGQKLLICAQGFLSPVRTRTGPSSPPPSPSVSNRNSVPTGRPSRSTPWVVIFCPRAPGDNNLVFSSEASPSDTRCKISSGIRCTCRRFAGAGLMCSLDRCWTVVPAWQSPWTPWFAIRVRLDAGDLEKVCALPVESERTRGRLSAISLSVMGVRC